jgi:hypothetical protein
MDFIMNGQGHGNVATRLLRAGGDVNVFRPWIGDDNKDYVTQNLDGEDKAIMVGNANATLRKDDWQLLDTAIIKAAKPRLKAVADLLGLGLTFNMPNGMAHTVLQTEEQSDISAADISMDGLRRSTADRPQFDIVNLPLPIIHKDFNYPLRQVLASRNGGSPLDTTTAELAGRRVAEEAEKLLLGTANTYTYGGGTIYGYTNFPQRLTATITAPTAGGWTAATTVNEILGMILQSQQAYHFGPYMVYFSLPWTQYLEDDYSSSKGDNTLRERVEKIENVNGVGVLDYLSTTNFVILVVQMTSEVVREVIGMNINTLQWDFDGGLGQNFKVMAIMVPQVRADYNGNTGIVHGTTA